MGGDDKMARLRMFRAGHGLSVEVKGVWHRIDCAVEIELEEGDSSDAIKRKAWETVDREIEKRLEEISEE